MAAHGMSDGSIIPAVGTTQELALSLSQQAGQGFDDGVESGQRPQRE